MREKVTQLKIRLPYDLHQKLKVCARKNQRTLSKEVTYILLAFFEQEFGLKKGQDDVE